MDYQNILANLSNRRMLMAAAERRLSFSQLLEREERSSDEDLRRGHDQYVRLVHAAGINTVTDLELGYESDTLEDSFGRISEQDGATIDRRYLFPEWVRRQWTRAQGYGHRASPEYLSSDYAVGSIQRPYEDSRELRQMQIQPAIPLSEIVARTTSIRGEDYRTLHLVEPAAADMRMMRVAEATDLPRVTLVTAMQSIRLKKYGRAIEVSYETLRRQTIDAIAVQIARIAVQAQVDQFAAALDVLINGDGNTGTAAAVHNLTALDPAAVAGTLTAKGWLAFKMKFLNPYALTTTVANADVALQMQLMSLGTFNIQFADVQRFGGEFSPINQALNNRVRLGVTDAAPALKIVAWDNRFGIERVIETGSLINEAERWILRQVEVMTMSENEGYAVFDVNAAKILNVNA